MASDLLGQFVDNLYFGFQDNWGTKETFFDVSLLDNFPVWAAPSRNIRITLKATSPMTFDLIAMVRATIEAKVVGA